MTLGKYPGGVPSKFLITAPATEAPGESVGRFVDVAYEAGGEGTAPPVDAKAYEVTSEYVMAYQHGYREICYSIYELEDICVSRLEGLCRKRAPPED